MSIEKLSDDEIKLLWYFRNMDKRSRELFLYMGEIEANRTCGSVGRKTKERDKQNNGGMR